MLVRQWQLIRALGSSRYGMTIPQLVERMGFSRSTVYRDLSVFEEAGVPVSVRTSNGEARYRLLRDTELPALGLSALQIAALHLARAELEPLAGTGLVAELDSLLTKCRPPERQQSFRFPPRGAGRPEVMRVVERALDTRVRARIEYRAASRGGTSSIVHVEPLVLNVAEGQPYLRAYCVERNAERTYKLARVARIELTKDPATYRAPRPPEDSFAHAVKAWSGEPTLVKIQLAPEVAWRADEYPLVSDQKVERRKDGSAVVQAQAAGIVETAQWVLSWGGAAEALEPPALRAAVWAELGKALAKYEGPGTTKAASNRAVITPASRVTHRETRGA